MPSVRNPAAEAAAEEAAFGAERDQRRERQQVARQTADATREASAAVQPVAAAPSQEGLAHQAEASASTERLDAMARMARARATAAMAFSNPAPYSTYCSKEEDGAEGKLSGKRKLGQDESSAVAADASYVLPAPASMPPGFLQETGDELLSALSAALEGGAKNGLLATRSGRRYTVQERYEREPLPQKLREQLWAVKQSMPLVSENPDAFKDFQDMPGTDGWQIAFRQEGKGKMIFKVGLAGWFVDPRHKGVTELVRALDIVEYG